MKKSTLLIALMFSVLSTRAQLTTGSLAITGNVGFSSQTIEAQPDDFKSTTFSFSPEFLYFASENVAVGLGVSISGTKDKPSDDKTSLVTFGPLVRYQGKLSDKATCFAQVNLNFGGGSSESEDSYVNLNNGTIVQYTRKDKFSLFSLALTPGVNYQIKKHFFLDFRYGILGYTGVNNKPDDTENKDVQDYKTSNFELSVDLSTLRLGALFMF